MAKKLKRAPEEASGDSNWPWGGYVGGEVCSGDGDEMGKSFGGRFGEDSDWDGDESPCCHDASRVTGEEFNYLGHFKNTKFLEDGHNTEPVPSDRMFQRPNDDISMGKPNPSPPDLFGGASPADAVRGGAGSYSARNGRRYGQ
jgi:hypothetical protein